MTRTESAHLSALAEAFAQKRLDLHFAKEMATMAEKRFKGFLQEIADRDDPPTVRAPDPEPKIDYLEEVADFKFEPTAANVILDEKG